MPKITKLPKSAFPRRRYDRRSRSVNRYWDAEDARTRLLRFGRTPKTRTSETHEASETVQVRMKRPSRVVRDRKSRPKRPRKKLTLRQILRFALNGLLILCAAAVVLFFVFVFPNTPLMLNHSAQKLLDEGDRDGAQALYEQVVAKDPGNATAIQGYTQIALDRGSVNEAIAFLRGCDETSNEVSSLLDKLVPTQEVEPAAGKYTERIRVTATTPRADVTLHYTLDGSPVTVDSPVLDHALVLPNGRTCLQVLAVADDGALGDAETRVYDVELRKPSPVTASLEPGEYHEKIVVTLSAAEGDVIRYTTDGSEPTVNSRRYTEPNVTAFDLTDEDGNVIVPKGGIPLDGGGETVIRAIAVSPEGVVSEEATFAYDLTGIVPDPVQFDQPGGFYYGALVLHLSTNRDDYVIYYTTNGYAPEVDTNYSYIYDGELILNVGFNAPIYAMAVSPQGLASDVTVAGYTIRSN